MSRKKINKPESPFKVRVENDGIYISALKQDNAQLTKLNYDLMKKYQVKTSDPVTNDVIDRIFVRHQQGMKKFKVTMAQNSKSISEWIEDTIEELIDATCYLSTLRDRINKRENDLLKENDRLIDELTVSGLLNDKKDKQIEDLKLEKIKQVEEAKKEADTLMINKMQKHYKETEDLKTDILTKDQELGRAYKKINELSNGKKT